jgi:hypothetical protein
MMRIFNQEVENAKEYYEQQIGCRVIFVRLLFFGVPHEIAFEWTHGKSNSGLEEIVARRELDLEDYQYKELAELIKSI